jgi:Carboxypeptidase regulatory-like domain
MRRFLQVSSAIAAAGLLAISSQTVWGQTTTGQITGTVEDATGAALPGAAVQAINTGTQVSRRVQTGASGGYVLPLLPPGNYQVLITKPGFQSLTENAVKLDVNQSLSINPKLTVGGTSETVQVQADSELLEATTSNLGTVIGERPVKDLPLNGRNFTQLLTLTPGATPISTSQGANQGTDDGSTVAIPGSSFANPSINGQQNRETLYLLDGVVNTDFRTTTYTVLPIIDGVSEFKVQSHNDDPAFGSVLGGVVNLITKSGTNQLHGSVWEFIRNNAFDARNPFTDVNGDGSPAKAAPFHQNEFGGAIGGPVWIPKIYNGRNKTFFFFSYEGWRYNQPSNNLYNVPTAAELGGDFSHSIGHTQIFDPTTTTANAAGTGYTRQAFTNSMIPAGTIDKQIQSYINTYFDKPNLTGNPNFNEILRAPYSNNNNNYQGRIDQTVTSHDTIFFRWSNMFVVNNNPATNTVTNISDFNGLNIGAGVTHVFSPKLVLNVNGGRASRGFLFLNVAKPGLGPLQQIGIGGLDLYGPLAINLASPYGSSSLGSAALRRNSAWSVGSQLTWQVGRHSLSFGETVIDQYRSQHGTGQNFSFDNEQTADPNNVGNTGNSLASALLGYPLTGGFQTQNTIKYSIPTYAVFAGDSWKVTPKLTVNVGLRYDHINQPNLTSGMNNGFNFDTGNWEIGGGKLPAACIVSGIAPCIPGTSTNAATNLASITGNDGSVAGGHIIVSPSATRAPASDNADWGPRFGFAYMATPSTVVRGGFGLVYDALNGLSQTFSNSIGEWPAKGSVTHNYNLTGAPLTSVAGAEASIGSPLTTGGPFSDFDFYYSPKNKPLYSEQFNLQVEQTVAKQTLLSIGYVGSISKRLDYGGTANGATTPGAGTAEQVTARRPYPYMTTFVYDSNTGAGDYHSLQVKLERRFSSGLQFLGSYTWSKSMDTGTSGRFGGENGPGGGGAVQDYYSPASNRSVSAYDQPQFASISGLYELPIGKNKRYLNSGPLSYVLGNWQVNTVAQLGSGQVYTLNVPGDIANIGVSPGYGRPNLIGNPTPSHPTKNMWFNPAAFATPVLSYGNVGRNSMRASSTYNDDLSLFKSFPIKDAASVEFRAEAFNIFNIINYGVPDPNLGDPQAGVVSSVAGNPRQLQFALKVSF